MRIALIGAICLLGMPTCFGDSGEELIALVDLKFLRETDSTASVLCLGEEESDCFVWGTHYLWRATVRKLYAGAEKEKHFLVLYGRHALLKKNLKGVTAILRRLEPDAPFGARYQIMDIGNLHTLICFNRPLPQADTQTLSRTEAEPQHCFDPTAD